MRIVVLAVCVLVACERADPKPMNATALGWIPTLPKMWIVVPASHKPMALGDPPDAYMFTTGSLREGLVTTLFVGRNRPWVPKDKAISRCDGVETVERAHDRVIIECETPKGRDVEVTLGELRCAARWTRADKPLNAKQLEIAREIERACKTLTIVE